MSWKETLEGSSVTVTDLYAVSGCRSVGTVLRRARMVSADFRLRLHGGGAKGTGPLGNRPCSQGWRPGL